MSIPIVCPVFRNIEFVETERSRNEVGSEEFVELMDGAYAVLIPVTNQIIRIVIIERCRIFTCKR